MEKTLTTALRYGTVNDSVRDSQPHALGTPRNTYQSSDWLVNSEGGPALDL